tara:strand:- start:35 stop:907 length:873 start_codon:yes stop_codon:yes gene_type:complete
MKSKKKLCASCLKFNFNKTLKSSKKQKPKWLNKIDYVENFVNNYNNFSNVYPKNYNKVMKLYIGKKNSNKKILYWAAGPPDHKNILINDAKTAYGNFSNSGVSSVDKYGFAIIKFVIPQNYKTIMKNGKKNTTFFKHIHFVISENNNNNNNNNKWNKQIYTKLVHNNYNYENFIKKLYSGKYVVLNVLPCTIYAKDHITNTYNLPYNEINKMSILELNNWLKELINLHYPILNDLLKKKKIEYYEIPIICYCAHNKCSASTIACEKLMKKGFVNVNFFRDGMKGYIKNKK